jgi:hypothetical protein
LEEFLASIESAAKLGRWQDTDCLQIAALRLIEPAKTFCKTITELQVQDVSWEKFKEVFRQRFRDHHPDQYHFTRLKTAKKAKNEDPQEFADRCRALAQTVMCKSNDPTAQKFHHDNAERMCMASFVAGLNGVAGRQVRYAHPQKMEQVLKIALAVTEAEKQERGEVFSTRALKNSHGVGRSV